MVENIQICTERPLRPIEKNIWRMIGLLLNRRAVFLNAEKGYLIQCNGKTLKAPQDNNRIPIFKTFSYGDKCYALYCINNDINISINMTCVKISADIFTHVVNLVSLYEEESNLKRDRCGLIEGIHSNRGKQRPDSLILDIFRDTVRLLSDLFEVPLFEIASNSPYIIALSFDVDGFLPGQIERLIPYLNKWRINKPTFMVMAFNDEEKTIYDPQYSLDDKEIKALWDSDVEIGLHSSYLAHDNPDYLYNQKQRLEIASGRKVLGHRSHYYRFAYPRSWVHQMRSGFIYDASMGYPDLPGLRNGTGVPLPLHDPDGFSNKIWTISTGCLDQHFFNDKSFLYCKNTKGKEMLDQHLERLRQTGGILSLDWHVHGFNSEYFPDHYKPLEYILDRAKEDGAIVLGIGELVQRYSKRWEELYFDNDNWQIRSDYKTKAVDCHELNSYKNTFSRENAGAVSIDNAAMSLVSTIPTDVESILDIGSGPGYISSKIPPFVKVLCMDLDEEILKYSTKPTCVGNITDIPLEDQSVDMVIACDIIEHLDENELKDAIKELKRISKKYIYIQTPLNEDLALGMIKCDNCGHKWHINYHRQSFTYNRLMSTLNEGWVPKTVNFTGDLSYYGNFEEKSILKKELDICENSFAGHTCPKCNNMTTLIEDKANGSIKKVVAASILEQSRIFPLYSEFGILFEYKGKKINEQETVIRTRSKKIYKLPQPKVLQNNEMDFSNSYYETDVFSGEELIPVIIPYGVLIERKEDGIELVKAETINNADVSFVFPKVLEKDDVFTLMGTTDRSMKLSICTYATTVEEILIGDFQVEGRFQLELRIPREANMAHAFFRMSWTKGELFINQAKITCSNSKEYYEYNYKQQDFSHIEYMNDGVLYRWLLSSNGTTYFSHTFSDWVTSLTYEKKIKPINLFMNYINKIDDLNKYLLNIAIKAKQSIGNTMPLEESNIDYKNNIFELERRLEEAKTYTLMQEEVLHKFETQLKDMEKAKLGILKQLDELKLYIMMQEEVLYNLEAKKLELEKENLTLKERLNEAELVLLMQDDIRMNKITTSRYNWKKLFKGVLRRSVRVIIKIVISVPVLYRLLNVPTVRNFYNKYIKNGGVV